MNGLSKTKYKQKTTHRDNSKVVVRRDGGGGGRRGFKDKW